MDRFIGHVQIGREGWDCCSQQTRLNPRGGSGGYGRVVYAELRSFSQGWDADFSDGDAGVTAHGAPRQMNHIATLDPPALPFGPKNSQTIEGVIIRIRLKSRDKGTVNATI